MKKEIIIDGNNFSTLEEFYNEVDRKFTKELDFKTGHNLNAFSDILTGGFGVHEYEESIKVIWSNAQKSEINFGWDATIEFLNNKIKTCHSSDIDVVKEDIKRAEKHLGDTLYHCLVNIILTHEHIELIIQ